MQVWEWFYVWIKSGNEVPVVMVGMALPFIIPTQNRLLPACIQPYLFEKNIFLVKLGY